MARTNSMRKAVETLPPPWMEGAKEINGHEMLVVHMNNGELEGLDNLQGGPSIDEETGIREYSALGPIIEMPEIKQIFHHIADEVDQHGKVSPDMEKIYKNTKKHSLPYREAPEEEHNPIKAMEKTGIDGDTKLALIPLNLAFLLIELRHVPSINPKTGLLMFARFLGIKVPRFVSNIVRIAGTIGGALLGGPLGAGAGRAIAGLATGQRLGDTFGSGLSHMGRAGMLSGIGGAIGHFAPGLASSIGSTVGPGIAGAAGNFFQGPMSTMGIGSKLAGAMGLGGAGAAAGAIPSVPLSSIGTVTNGASTLGRIAPGVANTAASTGPSLLSSLGGLSSLAPLAMSGLGYLGSKRQHKHDLKMQKENNDMIERQRTEMGYNKPWTRPEPRNITANPAYYDMSADDVRYGRMTQPAFLDEGARYAKGGLVGSYKQGTLVKGPGKGQDDFIKTSVPEGSYIIDASSTGMFGDGSSSAGASVLKKFEEQVKRNAPKHALRHVEKYVAKESKQVPVWLSNDEYKFDPITVTVMGKGSNTKGADILKQMVIKLRKHKISKGDGLPPKAKHPNAYISKGVF